MPLSWAMDHIGPMARTVADAALMLEVIAGHDPTDATSSPREVPGYMTELERSIAGLRVAIPENYYLDGVDAEVAAATRAALAAFERLGARVASLRLPDPQVIHDVSSIVAPAESSVIHWHPSRASARAAARGAGAPRDGLPRLAHGYLQALAARRLARGLNEDVLAGTDLLVVRAIPEPARLAGAAAGEGEAIAAQMGIFRPHRPWIGLGLRCWRCRVVLRRAGCPWACR